MTVDPICGQTHERQHVGSNDRRVISDRQQRAFAAVDLQDRQASGTPTFAGQVYNGGSMPSVVPAWYLTHPVELSGSESEGGSYSPTADSSLSIPVIVLNKVPSVGDILIAEMVGSKWVAELGGCTAKIRVVCSAAPVSGATVIVSAGAFSWTGTSDSAGYVSVPIPAAGTYAVQVSGGSCEGTTLTSLVLACGGSYTVNCCNAYCGCPGLFEAGSVSVTDSGKPGLGTITLNWTTAGGSFGGQFVATVTDPATGITVQYQFACTSPGFGSTLPTFAVSVGWISGGNGFCTAFNSAIGGCSAQATSCNPLFFQCQNQQGGVCETAYYGVGGPPQVYTVTS